jgi:membrane-associated phospholipid phosphatase
MGGCAEVEGKEPDSNSSAGAERGVLTVTILISGILAVAITSHLLNPELPDGREFSEGAWYSTDVVHFCQRTLSGFDDFLAFVSSASNPAQILHRVVPLLASVKGPQVALKVLVAYVAADVSNLALKWPLQGDRPFWMDREIRQFGGNTCEVGFGMPSGHVQVTVASYAVLASSFKNTPMNGLVLVAVVLTAVSRVHMGAHTPLQVTCGGIAGIATALSVGIAEKAIIDWASHRMSNNARLAYAGAVTVTIIVFIAMENAFLLSQGINIYASVSYAMSACRGGLHAVVSSARGIARDVGALLGGILGL